MAKQVIILGAGGVGPYVSYILDCDSEVEVVGFTDRNSDLWGTEIYGKPVLGSDDVIPDLYAKGVRYAVVGVAIPDVRARLGKMAADSGLELINAIHPSAIVPPTVQLGNGVILAAGAILSHNPIIEDNTWLGLGAVVGHDTRVGRDVLVGGRAAVGADVEVGDRVLLGFGSVIGREVKIGDDAIVGSGANVVHNVPARAVVFGNPARVMRYRDG